MRFRSVPELGHQWMPLERLLDDAALHTLAAPVDQPYQAKLGRMRRGHVLIHHRGDVPRGKRMEIDDVFYRNLVGQRLCTPGGGAGVYWREVDC